VAAVLMMKFGHEGRLCGDGETSDDVGWCYGSRPLWGAQVAAQPTRHIGTDQPGDNVTTGNRSGGSMRED
jgi:hypothetical protein